MMNLEYYKKELINFINKRDQADYNDLKKDIAFDKINEEFMFCCSSNCHKCLFKDYKPYRCPDQLLLWLCDECKKITELERTILTLADKEGYCYIVRNKNGLLTLFTDLPAKVDDAWISSTGTKEHLSSFIGNDVFKSIQWKNKQPQNIKELL